MYVPSSFDVPDGRIVESYISRYGFATLLAGLEGEGTSDAALLARFIREHAGV